MPNDTPLYFASDVARAAGIDSLTLQNWLKRDAFGFTQHDRIGKGPGSRNLFTLRSAFILAVTAEIVRNGVAPQYAYRVAGSFFRKGALPDTQKTYVYLQPGGAGFVQVLAEYLTLETLFAPQPDTGDDIASALVVDASKIWARTVEKLSHQN